MAGVLAGLRPEEPGRLRIELRQDQATPAHDCPYPPERQDVSRHVVLAAVNALADALRFFRIRGLPHPLPFLLECLRGNP